MAAPYDAATGEVSLTGNSEVQGFEVGATGSITDRWDIAAGYTYLDAKTVKYANSRESFDGKQAKFIAPHSGSVWTTYMLTERWKVGGGASYMSKRYVDGANIQALMPTGVTTRWLPTGSTRTWTCSSTS